MPSHEHTLVYQKAISLAIKFVDDQSQSRIWLPNDTRKLRQTLEKAKNQVRPDSSMDDIEPELRSSIQQLANKFVPDVPDMKPFTTNSTPRFNHRVEVRQHMMTGLSTWNYDCDALQELTRGKALATLFYYLLEEADLIQRLHLNPQKVRRFADRVERGYLDNPYHNSVHAACVLHCMHCILFHGGLLQRFEGMNTDLILLSAYVAALVHDFRHPGVDNNMLVTTRNRMAYKCNDVSVCENYHLVECYKLLNLPETAFMEDLDVGSYKFVRHLVIKMVLKTDMRDHFSTVTAFQEADELSHVQLLEMALKCADVSHTTYDWNMHGRWVTRLEEENYLQGDIEKSLDIPVSPLKDRDKAGIKHSQADFLKIVVEPMMICFVHRLPATQPLLDGLRRNIHLWTDASMHH